MSEKREKKAKGKGVIGLTLSYCEERGWEVQPRNKYGERLCGVTRESDGNKEGRKERLGPVPVPSVCIIRFFCFLKPCFLIFHVKNLNETSFRKVQREAWTIYTVSAFFLLTSFPFSIWHFFRLEFLKISRSLILVICEPIFSSHLWFFVGSYFLDHLSSRDSPPWF